AVEPPRLARQLLELAVVDLSAGSDLVLSALVPERYQVTAVESDDRALLHWEQHRGGVSISRIDRSPSDLAGVYRLQLQPAAEAIRLYVRNRWLASTI
ncbi:MAG TPA: hypothetical protein PLV68_14610, partial [Ilumatobacteraceae bacterium]|nr:hypothetical protein [Ilumatobacteraceae bacterium]